MTLGDLENVHLFVWPLYISTTADGEQEKYDYIPSKLKGVEIKYLYPSFTVEPEQMPNRMLKPCLCAIVDAVQWRKAGGGK